MRARYPDTEGFVERDGVKIAYEVFGSGEPTVAFAPTDPLVHSRAWKAQVPSVSWVPSRTTLNVPARRSSTAVPLTDPAGPDLPTCTSYRRRSRCASGSSAATRAVAGLSGLGPG